MILIYEGANIHTLSAGARHRVRLVPGQNEVPDAVWAEVLEKSTGAQHLIETGKLRELRAEREDGTPVSPKRSEEVNVAQLKVISVREIVENTMDPEKLREYRAQERRRAGGARKSVMDLLDHRIGLLTAPPKGEGESETAGEGEADPGGEGPSGTETESGETESGGSALAEGSEGEGSADNEV